MVTSLKVSISKDADARDAKKSVDVEIPLLNDKGKPVNIVDYCLDRFSEEFVAAKLHKAVAIDFAQAVRNAANAKTNPVPISPASIKKVWADWKPGTGSRKMSNRDRNIKAFIKQGLSQTVAEKMADSIESARPKA